MAFAKHIKLYTILFLTLFLTAFYGSQAKAESYDGFALVELFTTQAKEDCLQGEKAFTELIQWANKQSVPVYPLAFHVDFWDDDQWSDPFGTEENSLRQLDYVINFRIVNRYVPQVVINGSEHFKARASKMKRKAQSAMSDKVSQKIDLDVSNANRPNVIEVLYEVTGVQEMAAVRFAVVQRNLVTEVTGGENKGKTLKCDNVVRSFKSVLAEDAEKKSVFLTLPDDLKMQDSSVIAFVQNLQDRKITAAAKADLSEVN